MRYHGSTMEVPCGTRKRCLLKVRVRGKASVRKGPALRKLFLTKDRGWKKTLTKGSRGSEKVLVKGIQGPRETLGEDRVCSLAQTPSAKTPAPGEAPLVEARAAKKPGQTLPQPYQAAKAQVGRGIAWPMQQPQEVRST